MSAASLRVFIEKLDRELSKRSDAWRASSANYEIHTFSFSKVRLENETKKVLKAQGQTVTAKDAAEIKKLASAMGEVVWAELQKLAPEDAYLKRPGGKMLFEFSSSTELSRANPWNNDPDNIFRKVKEFYQPELKKFFAALQDYLRTQETTDGTNKQNKTIRSGKSRKIKGKKVYLGREKKGTRNVFDAGHEEGGGIAETTIRNAFKTAADTVINSDWRGQGVTQAGLMKQLNAELSKDGGTFLKLIRNDKDDSYTLSIECSSINRSKGSKIGARKTKFKKELKAILDKMPPLHELEGSDSIKVKVRKEIVRGIAKPFKNKKGIRVKTENTKKNSKSHNEQVNVPSGKIKKSNKNTTVAVASVLPKMRRKKKRKPQAPKAGLKNILGIINAKLPETVADNMGSPRLENRTGRFAQSARAIDVTETAGGFQSIGYTYEKKPYQVFESTSGTRFSSAARDPRTLIDFSIREIVAQFGLGRLYTRRL